MRKLSILILTLFSVMAYGQKDYKVSFEQTRSDAYQLYFDVTHWDLQTATFDGVTYQVIDFSQNTVTEQKGWAELPFISASVQLPARKNVDLEINYSEYQDIHLEYPLLPSRGVIYRNQNPDEIPYYIDPKSIEDKFYPETLAFAEDPFIIRDVRGTSVRVFPFQWNAVTQTLRIYTKVTVSLVENNEPATNPLLKENPTPIREVVGMYRSMFINYMEPKQNLAIASHGDILVVTTARDEAAIEPYIAWKKEKGYNVSKEIVATGTNVKSLIKQKYDENNNLMYVLLIGDWADIKSDVYTSSPTDPMLGDVAGSMSDYRPEVAVGRMSANNPAQVTIQVNKAIQYEKNPNMDAGWYESFIGIASNEGSGAGDDGEIDYTHIQRIYSERLESPKFTYNVHRQNYAPSASASTLTGHINTGASTIAYCGHGSETTFVTTGFNNNNVNQLTNGEKLPFIVSVACVNGAFHISSDCFAEAWLRKENGGAVVTWMSTINQPWTPPQRGQDYFYDILIGGFDYDQYSGQNGINTNEQRTNWGSIVVNAANLMLSENSSSSDKETVRTWCTFGDPSLQLRTALPKTITSSQNIVLEGTAYETTITANGSPIANALVCLSQNNVYVKGFTNAQGQISLPQEFLPGEVLLVVTGFNTTTIYQTLNCIGAQGVHVVYASHEINDDNGQLDYYDESVKLNFTVKNLGNEAASNMTVTITSNDPIVNIINGTATFSSIAAHGTATVNDAFEISISGTIPDQYPIPFTVTSIGNGTNESTFFVVVNSAKPEITEISINDIVTNNLEAGETSFVTLMITNNGHSNVFNLEGELSTNNSNISIAYNLNSMGDLAAGESKEMSFIVLASETLPAGNAINFDLKITGDNDYNEDISFSLVSNDYCIPETTGCSEDKFIRVKFSNIENNNTICENNGYSDYTSMEANLIPGQTYSIEVKCGYAGDRVRGWFDFNGDKLFDNSEVMFTINCASATQSYTANFTVPMDAKPGKNRIRLRISYNNDPTGPCFAWQYGQTHDYTMVIPEIFPKVGDLTVEQGHTGILISWEAPEIKRSGLVLKEYKVYRNSEYLESVSLANKSFHDSNIPEGAFIYKIYAVYEGGVSLPNMTDILFVKGKPSELQATALETAYAIKLTWTAPQLGASGYNIYRDGELLTTTPITNTTYTDENLEKETQYCYFVTAIFDDVESEATEEICATTRDEMVGICDVAADVLFDLYPNPAHETVILSGSIIPTQIQLFNLTGQLVYRTETCDKNMNIPLSSLPSGIYFIKIDSAQGSTTKKIIVQ